MPLPARRDTFCDRRGTLTVDGVVTFHSSIKDHHSMRPLHVVVGSARNRANNAVVGNNRTQEIKQTTMVIQIIISKVVY